MGGRYFYVSLRDFLMLFSLQDYQLGIKADKKVKLIILNTIMLKKLVDSLIKIMVLQI